MSVQAISSATFNSTLRTLNSKINSFEHQVTWQLDNNKPVTAPAGTASTTTAGSDTIANGFSSLESTFESNLKGLTTDQQSQLGTAQKKLDTEQARFEKFSSKRTSTDAHSYNKFDGLTRNLQDNINAFEHQVSWEVDNGKAVTAPNTGTAAATDTTTAEATTADSTAATGTTATASQTIADGFASLEAQSTKLLGHLTVAQSTRFQQLQQRLSTEQTRFTSFIARQSAYKSSAEAAGATQDVSG